MSLSGDNVMDVKIGSITWDHLASPEKIETEKSKYLFVQQLGFRILGFRVKDRQGQRHQLEKSQAKLLRPEDVAEKLGFFLSPDADESVLDRRRTLFLRKLNDIKDHMDRQTSHRFISSSVLLSYETTTEVEDRIQVKMIDFAHTHLCCPERQEVDQNYIQGLNSFINYFSKAVVTR